VAALSPLPVVAAAVSLTWPWWVSLIHFGVVVACASEFGGWFAGTMAAMVSTVGLSLLLERADHPDHPRNGIELGAMAILLLIVGVAGTDRTVD